MRKLVFILAFSIVSCNSFSLKKLSAEDILEQELKVMNWDDVDVYPTFDACEEYSEKTDLKQCFESTFTTHIYEALYIKVDSLKYVESDTIAFVINELGQVQISKDKDLLLSILESWCEASLKSLQKTYPAQKRGIPVSTVITIPILIKESD